MKLPKFLSQNEKLREWLTQFVKFGLVGAVNTLLSLGINYLFIWIDPSLYLWGNFAGWAVSVLNAFYWNNRFVFQKKAATQKELWLRLGKSYVSYGASFLLSTLLMWLEVRKDRVDFSSGLAASILKQRCCGYFGYFCNATNASVVSNPRWHFASQKYPSCSEASQAPPFEYAPRQLRGSRAAIGSEGKKARPF